MKKFFKWLAILLAIPIILVIVVVLIFMSYHAYEEYKVSAYSDEFVANCSKIENRSQFRKKIEGVESEFSSIKRRVDASNITVCTACGGYDYKLKVTKGEDESPKVSVWRMQTGYSKYLICTINYDAKLVVNKTKSDVHE